MKYSTLKKINITGGNIFLYKEYDHLISFLSSLSIEVNLFIHYNNFNATKIPEKLKSKKNILYSIIVDFFDGENLFNDFFLEFENDMSIRFCFIARSDECMEIIKNTTSKLNINNFTILPYLTPNNSKFFVDNVFLNSQKLLCSRQPIESIFRKQVLNNFNFGSLYIDCNGDIYSSMLSNNIGNANSTSIRESIYNELNFGSTWNYSRENKESCSGCSYRFLCPSVSTYEQFAQKEGDSVLQGCIINFDE